MLMLDVRNTIANILDRYTLADTVDITLRKMRQQFDLIMILYGDPLSV